MWRPRVITNWLMRSRGGILRNGVDLSGAEDHSASVDPFGMCEADLQEVAKSVEESVKGYEASPVLERAAEYFLSLRRERFRPVTVLLLAHAVTDGDEHRMTIHRKFAEVVEMLHIASVLHNEIVDDADMKKDNQRLGTGLSNGLSLLAGDFLLARSVTLLAELRNCRVVELMANVIEAIVHGDVLHRESPNAAETFDDYIKKSFLKTAALLANAGTSVMTLENRSEADVANGFAYGKHLGMAYRLASDVRNMERVLSERLRRESVRNLLAMSATGPVLHTAEGDNRFKDALSRGFSGTGDDPLGALESIRTSGGIERTAAQAMLHAESAIDAARQLTSNSPVRSALINMVDVAVKDGS
uniref:Uncharacterized protein n=1 Tax=Rhodosorus marinus TaxID=101924 RepID=A0A7S2Z9N2_9RHOD|mmetsp:Transcript_11279/g.47052  ORF Transcript_11279/g.47052 Transcript_11279/m.47052 type:complete len:359 (+) Transcript_11279:694-1770(+)|eukprot:CAMPEP_0113955500 /NCGR_PEP_ID=MMETSP0011_2-20120614/1382_1 /TAXON_ID=101924 /ORGANISM="Rhodosorus marinus" /LENGTH=358 /DNA_ID=CAMNT_0000965225 /DNA_START=186 /DNA_END=1262 /DNA_ORIENTATION=+ /assembly_acc=CAM_ASM_000156